MWLWNCIVIVSSAWLIPGCVCLPRWPPCTWFRWAVCWAFGCCSSVTPWSWDRWCSASLLQRSSSDTARLVRVWIYSGCQEDWINDDLNSSLDPVVCFSLHMLLNKSSLSFDHNQRAKHRTTSQLSSWLLSDWILRSFLSSWLLLIEMHTYTVKLLCSLPLSEVLEMLLQLSRNPPGWTWCKRAWVGRCLCLFFSLHSPLKGDIKSWPCYL